MYNVDFSVHKVPIDNGLWDWWGWINRDNHVNVVRLIQAVFSMEEVTWTSSGGMILSWKKVIPLYMPWLAQPTSSQDLWIILLYSPFSSIRVLSYFVLSFVPPLSSYAVGWPPEYEKVCCKLWVANAVSDLPHPSVLHFCTN